VIMGLIGLIVGLKCDFGIKPEYIWIQLWLLCVAVVQMAVASLADTSEIPRHCLLGNVALRLFSILMIPSGFQCIANLYCRWRHRTDVDDAA
jgi:hypothetical protein